MQAQNRSYIHMTEISNDQDLQSLFKKYESVEHYVRDQQIQKIVDFQFDRKEVQRDYHSDQEVCSRKNKNAPVSRIIINKKQQRKKKKRTKNYIKVLQQKISELTAQIERLKKVNKINKQYIHRLNQSEHVINGYFVGRQQVIQKLEVLNTQQESVENTKIQEEIISLRLRQGVFGKDRVKAVNYYFREMVEMVLPQIQKYIIKTAIEQQDFFDINYLKTGILPHDVENWRKIMLQNIGSQIKQKDAKEYFYNNRQKIIVQSQKFKQILIDFNKLKCKLIEQAKKLEQVHDGAHKFMKPLSISKSLCYIDKYRFEKNITLEHTFKQVFKQIQNNIYHYQITRPFCINN